MFEFGFSKNNEIEENDVNTKKLSINWLPASVIEVTKSEIETHYEPNNYTENLVFPGCKLKLIRSEKALQDLKAENCTNILEAELQHSDLIPAQYEGGLKIWECSYDLCSYIFKNNIKFQDNVVLDLGCGAGIIGLIALLENSVVHFQDYNAEVIKTMTIPNVLLNFENRESILKRCKFFSGDWESFMNINSEMYDLIFTSETIYNPENHRKLYQVFKQGLKQNGIGYIGGKSYYFGVGGGMRQFQCLIEEDGIFNVEVAWKSQGGLQREILKIRRTQL